MLKFLDLFCGAGGAAMGLHRAFPDALIIGIDMIPQLHYPFVFIQGDALNPPFNLSEFDFIWASPPCQAYTFCSIKHRDKGKKYPELIEPVREMLSKINVPHIIENVATAPLHHQVTLCGQMFGLRTFRHRRFESNCIIFQPTHYPHHTKSAGLGRVPKDDKTFWTITGKVGGAKGAQEIMDIHHIGSGSRLQKEISNAIPPAYSEYLIKQIFHQI